MTEAALSILLWFVWICIAMFTTAVDTPTQAVSLGQICYLLMGTCIFCVWTARKLPGGYSSVYFIMLMSLVAFNAAQAFIIPFSDTDATTNSVDTKFLLTRQFSDDVIVATFSIVGCYLASIQAAALVQFLVRSAPLQTRVGPPIAVKSDEAIAGVALALFTVSAPVGLSQLWTSLNVVLSKGYFGLYDPEALQYQSLAGVLVSFAIPAAFYVLAMYRSWFRWLAFAYISMYGVAMLAMGFRAWGMFTLIALAWTYHRAISSLSQRAVLVAATFVIGLLPIIGATRTTAFSDLSFQQVTEAYQEIGSPLIALFSETGGSAGTVAWTFTLVPSERPFGYGSSILNSASAVVPNLTGGTHLAAESSLSSWLAWRTNPQAAAVGGGIGFSAFAEVYFNFGLLFGVLVTFAMGWLLASISSKLERDSVPVVMIGVGGVLLSFLPMFARADSSMLFRPLVWFILIPLLIRALMPISRAGDARPTAQTRRSSL